MYYNPLMSQKLRRDEDLRLGAPDDEENEESLPVGPATARQERFALGGSGEEGVLPTTGLDNQTDDKQVLAMPEGQSFKESPNSTPTGLSALRNRAATQVMTDRNISSYFPKIPKNENAVQNVKNRFSETREDLQKRSREASLPMQEIANQNRENIATSKEDAKEAMRKALLAKAGSRALSTLGMGMDKMGSTPFGRPDNSNIYKNTEQTGNDIMQGAKDQEQTARQTFQDYLTAQQAANQFGMAPIQEESAINRSAQEAMRNQFDLESVGKDMEGKELDNLLKQAQYANILAPKPEKASSGFSEFDKFNLTRRNRVLDDAGKEGGKQAKSWEQFNATTNLVPKKPDGSPDFDKMDQGATSLFGTNVSKMINGGQMSDLDVNTALGKIGWTKTIPALVNPFASDAEKRMARAEAARIFKGQSVNRSQLKNLYNFIEGKERALNEEVENIVKKYAKVGSETTDFPSEYYDEVLRGMLGRGKNKGNKKSNDSNTQSDSGIDVVSLGGL